MAKMKHSLFLAWAAGFLDGEGSFSIRSNKRGRDTTIVSTAPIIRVAQASPRLDILHQLQRSFGGTIQNKHLDTKNTAFNEAFELVIAGHLAVSLCRQLLPYLRVKKRHAQIILEHQATKIPPGNIQGQARTTLRVTDIVIQLRERQMDELNQLNRRGTKRLPRKTLLRIQGAA